MGRCSSAREGFPRVVFDPGGCSLRRRVLRMPKCNLTQFALSCEGVRYAQGSEFRGPRRRRARKGEKEVAVSLVTTSSCNPCFVHREGEITPEATSCEPLCYHVSMKQILGAAESYLGDKRLVVSG